MDVAFGSTLFSDTVDDQVKIPRQVFEIVEELRLQRIKDAENEVKLSTLNKDRVELISKIDDLKRKIKLVEGENLIKIEELQATNFSQLTAKEEVIRRQNLLIETNEKEVKLLRDEVCRFQLTNFALERKTNDQEKKLIQLSSILEKLMDQKSRFECCFKACREESRAIEAEVNKLKSEVEECKRINKNYDDSNRRFKNEVQDMKSELKNLECQLTYANAKNARFNLIEEMLENGATFNEPLHEENKFFRMTNGLLSEKAENFEKELIAMQEMVSKYQMLLEAHDVNNSKCQARVTELEDELNSCERKCEMLVSDFENYKLAIEVAEKKHQKEIEMLLSEKDLLEMKLFKLEGEYDEAKKVKMDLEDLNSKWASKNLELINIISQDSRMVDPDLNCTSTVGSPSIEVVGSKFLDVRDDNLSNEVCTNLSCIEYNASSGGAQVVPLKNVSAGKIDQEMAEGSKAEITEVYRKIISSSTKSRIGRSPTVCNDHLNGAAHESSLKRSISPSLAGQEGAGEKIHFVEPRMVKSPADKIDALSIADVNRSFDDVVQYIVTSGRSS